MTMLEKFVAFARDLPADRLASLEEVLAELMASYSASDDLTPEELAELDRRVAEENPEYADPEEIAAIFGKKFG
jgi:hypothetical protein